MVASICRRMQLNATAEQSVVTSLSFSTVISGGFRQQVACRRERFYNLRLKTGSAWLFLIEEVDESARRSE